MRQVYSRHPVDNIFVLLLLGWDDDQGFGNLDVYHVEDNLLINVTFAPLFVDAIRTVAISLP